MSDKVRKHDVLNASFLF